MTTDNNTPERFAFAQEVAFSGSVEYTFAGRQVVDKMLAEYRDAPPECTWQGTCPACTSTSEVRWMSYREQVHCPACGVIVATYILDADVQQGE